MTNKARSTLEGAHGHERNGRLRLWRDRATASEPGRATKPNAEPRAGTDTTDAAGAHEAASPEDDLSIHVRALRNEVSSLQGALHEAKETITYLEDRQRIDALLSAADTIDIEASRLLTMATLASMDEPDIEAAVASVREHKPYLFPRASDEAGSDASETETPDKSTGHRPRGPYPFRSIAMAPAIGPTSAQRMARSLTEAADQAVSSGRRDDLLRYLRLRRAIATDPSSGVA